MTLSGVTVFTFSLVARFDSLIATSLGVPDAIDLAIFICSFIDIVLVATEIIYIV